MGVWCWAGGRVLIDCLECQFAFENVASGIKASRLCPDQFIAADFFVFVR